MVYLPTLELTDTVVPSCLFRCFPSFDCAGTVKGKLRRSPGTDTGDPHPQPVDFIHHHLLYMLGLPEMEPLFLRPFLLSRSIQVFEYDRIHVILYCLFHDKGRCPYRNIVIDAVYRSPQARYSLCSVPLGFLKPSRCMVQTVVFCRKGKKFPSCDRAVCFHDTAGTGVVDPKIHGKDPGVPDLFFFQFYFFLEGKVQIPLLSPLP